jgi:hypothetical protein
VLDVPSATNRSPFGATRMTRGPAKPDVTVSTEKPDGTWGLAPAGVGTTSTQLEVEVPTGGKSSSVNSRFTPGLSCPPAECCLAFQQLSVALFSSHNVAACQQRERGHHDPRDLEQLSAP